MQICPQIDSVQSLITCPGVLVCVGREAFSPMQVNFIRKSSEEKLPGLGSKSPGLGPRTPGNGARSPATHGGRSPPHGAHSRASECSEGQESKKNGKFKMFVGTCMAGKTNRRFTFVSFYFQLTLVWKPRRASSTLGPIPQTAPPASLCRQRSRTATVLMPPPRHDRLS